MLVLQSKRVQKEMLLSALNVRNPEDSMAKRWNHVEYLSFTHKRLDMSPGELSWVIKFSAKLWFPQT